MFPSLLNLGQTAVAMRKEAEVLKKNIDDNGAYLRVRAAIEQETDKLRDKHPHMFWYGDEPEYKLMSRQWAQARK